MEIEAWNTEVSKSDIDDFNRELRAAVKAGIRLDLEGSGATSYRKRLDQLATLESLEPDDLRVDDTRGADGQISLPLARYRCGLLINVATGAMDIVLEAWSTNSSSRNQLQNLVRGTAAYLLVLVGVAAVALVFLCPHDYANHRCVSRRSCAAIPT